MLKATIDSLVQGQQWDRQRTKFKAKTREYRPARRKSQRGRDAAQCGHWISGIVDLADYTALLGEDTRSLAFFNARTPALDRNQKVIEFRPKNR
jgi:hypothetical protein